jgi:thioredoxin-like negative regulator of GroEL
MSNDGSGKVLLLVTRRTSGVGRRMESMLARLQLRVDQRGVKVRRVDADARPELVERLSVEEIPSIVVLEGSRAVARLRGRATLDEVEQVLALERRA